MKSDLGQIAVGVLALAVVAGLAMWGVIAVAFKAAGL